jgi:HlyD family secretion protein
MKTWKKVALGVGGLAVVGTIVAVSLSQANKGVVEVQTAKLGRQDLMSLVTASGEVRPKTYSNVGGEGFGKIVEIFVKEGDRVKAGDTLLRLEATQVNADVDAQTAALSSAEAGMRSAEANARSAQAELTQRKADFEKARFDWERAEKLFKDELISRSEYDARKSQFDGMTAAIEVSNARVNQTRAELERARSMQGQSTAVLTRARDVQRKTNYVAPISGVVTYVAVRKGEHVVAGIQNSPGSYLMTISDLSLVTAEVKVDETDIVNVRHGQECDVTIDAVPGMVFKARVTEVGNQAVLRTSGLATTQTTSGSQEAKDFKVVCTLDSPSDNIRPGLSTTAKIKTAERKNALALPLQALAVRTRQDLEDAKNAGQKGGGNVTLAASKSPEGKDPKKEEIQGVFVIRDKKAVFVPVKTGVTGITEIEVVDGLKEGEEIVTGSYRALRSLKPGATVKVDNNKSGENQGT